MKRLTATILLISVLLTGFALNAGFTVAASSAGNTRLISVVELKARLGDNSLVVMDVRLPKHYQASQFKIKGAVWVNPQETDRWIDTFPKDATYVLY